MTDAGSVPTDEPRESDDAPRPAGRSAFAATPKPGAPGRAIERDDLYDVRVVVEGARNAGALARALDALRGAAERGAHVECAGRCDDRATMRGVAARYRFVRDGAPAVARPFEVHVSCDVECGPEAIVELRRSLERRGEGVVCDARPLDPAGVELTRPGVCAWIARRADLDSGRALEPRTAQLATVLVPRPSEPVRTLDPRAAVARATVLQGTRPQDVE